MTGAFEFAGTSGPQRRVLARVAPFALCPTPEQYAHPVLTAGQGCESQQELRPAARGGMGGSQLQARSVPIERAAGAAGESVPVWLGVD